MRLSDMQNVARFAGKDVGRYAVNGVQVRPGGSMVATDSRRMVRLTPATPEPTIERQAILHHGELSAMLPKGSTIASVNGSIVATTPAGNVELPAARVEVIGEFPDADRVMPTSGFKLELELNPALLADLGAVFQRFQDEHSTTTRKGRPAPATLPHVRVKIRDAESAVMFEVVAEDGSKLEALVMPITKS